MILKEVYSKYKIPLNLQEHMLRVTGIAKLIASSWAGPSLDTKILISACLAHDLGNLLKFDLVNKANFLGEDTIRIDYWKKVKEEMIQKYGPDEHASTFKICKEIGLNSKSLWIVQNWGFSNLEKVLDSDNWEYKIGVYSDHRIGPFDIVTLKERFDEQKKRYSAQNHSSEDISAHLSDRSDFLVDCAFKVEKQIRTKTEIDLDDVFMNDIEIYFDDFLKIEI